MITARHLEGYRFELRAGGHVACSDQRSEYGGEDGGPMPSELLLWSVGACFGQALAHVAVRAREPLPGLALEVEGEKDTREFRFSRITVGVSAGIATARLERAIGRARKICFVTNSLEGKVALEFRANGLP